MSKNEVLTDEEILKIDTCADRVIDALRDGRAIEQAVLAKLTAGVELPPLPTPLAKGGAFHNSSLRELVEEWGRQAIAADRARLAWQEAIVGTKTWFEDGKVIVQNLTAGEVYASPVPAQAEKVEPDVLDMASDMQAAIANGDLPDQCEAAADWLVKTFAAPQPAAPSQGEKP